MRRTKWLLSLVLAFTMILGMTITATAANKSATITVTGADEATLTYAQVVKADPTTETGWAIVDGFEDVFASFGNDEQSQIKGYIEATESARAQAIKDAAVSTSTAFTNPLTVTEPGLYLINGTEEGFVYNPMLAYVGFDSNTGDSMGLVDTILKAKKTPISVGKTYADENKFVQVGDEVEYTLTATVPYAPKGSQTTFVITDTLTGGEFKVNDEDKVEVKVSIENEARTIAPTENKTKLTIDLTDLIDADNTNANAVITIKYTAIVTGTVITNDAYIGNDPSNSTTVTSYTGKLQITKFNEADATEKVKLAGATFVVIGPDGKYAIIKDGKLDGWTENVTEDCYIVTGSDGTATVEGFDPDKTYTFHEEIAPEGYALNPNDATADWKENQADDAQIAEASMNDSKLAELPFTGGSGTAAFTIFGVILMSFAAGLYFINKKNKSVK